MAIKEGDRIPDVALKTTEMKDVTTQELFGGRKVVLFAVPGAFTPTCGWESKPRAVTVSSAAASTSFTRKTGTRAMG